MIDGFAFPPALFLIFTGLACLVLPAMLRPFAVLGAPVVTLAAVWSFAAQMAVAPEDAPFSGEVYAASLDYLGLTLYPVRVDPLSLVFATVFAIMAFAGGLYALRLEDRRELALLQVYAGAAIGAVLAGDLLTLFVFWELMAIASVLIIWAGGPDARGAGLRYAGVHFLGGACLMAGAAGYVATTGEAAFGPLPQEGVIGGLALIGILINAAAWPLNAWLADAYPRASWAGTVFLSAFTTKTAIYALIRGFPGDEWLIWIGIATIAYGCLYALVETDLRRLLCFAIVAQGGFMMVGVGIGTPMALNGAAGHAFVSILYSATLFMAAGALLRGHGTAQISAFSEGARHMPQTALLAGVAALSLAALPGTGAYISKSLISSGAGKADAELAYLLLSAAAAGVVLHAGRFVWVGFLARGSAPSTKPIEEPGPEQRLAMLVPLALVLVLAVVPGSFYAFLPEAMDAYTPYKADTLLLQLQLLVFGVLALYYAVRLIPDAPRALIDTDWLYRRLGRALLGTLGHGWLAAYAQAAEKSLAAVQRLLVELYRIHGPNSTLASTRQTGYVALWMTALLSVLVLSSVL
ncbi:MAG: proton-conducting transporter membrane subunit [Pseudomonadota bacterium]